MPKVKTPPFGQYLTISGASKELKVSRQAITEAINRGPTRNYVRWARAAYLQTALAAYKKTRHPGGRPKTKRNK